MTTRQPGPSNSLPLSGVRVLDLGMNIAGPQAASMLADLGADVIKVESPQGDTSRGLEPKLDGLSAMVVAMNRRKRYLALDLRNPEGAPVRDALLRWADVAVQNLRPGKADELGVGADACHDVNPRLVHVGIEAFYPAEGTRPGYDLLVQAETGMMHLNGHADRPPARLPGSLLDHTTGIYTAFGIAAALHGPRDRHALTVSMSDVAQNLIADRVAAYLVDGVAPERMGSEISVTTPLQSYRTADGDLAIGAASDALFRRLSTALGVQFDSDPRFVTQADRLTHRDELGAAIEEILATADTDTWFDRLDEAGVPVGRVRDLPGAVERHRTMSRTGLVPVEGLPGAELVASALGATVSPRRPGLVGADSRAVVVDELGFDDARYEALVASGAVVEPVGVGA